MRKKANNILTKIDELEENGIWFGEEYDSLTMQYNNLDSKIRNNLYKLSKIDPKYKRYKEIE